VPPSSSNDDLRRTIDMRGFLGWSNRLPC
jgi:hypothetical protein